MKWKLNQWSFNKTNFQGLFNNCHAWYLVWIKLYFVFQHHFWFWTLLLFVMCAYILDLYLRKLCVIFFYCRKLCVWDKVHGEELEKLLRKFDRSVNLSKHFFSFQDSNIAFLIIQEAISIFKWPKCDMQCEFLIQFVKLEWCASKLMALNVV